MREEKGEVQEKENQEEKGPRKKILVYLPVSPRFLTVNFRNFGWDKNAIKGMLSRENDILHLSYFLQRGTLTRVKLNEKI